MTVWSACWKDISVCRLPLLAVLCAIVACQPAGEHGVRPEQITEALSAGRYEEAERLATLRQKEVERAHGVEALATAHGLDLLLKAALDNGKAGESSTIDLAGRAVRLKEQHLGPDHLDTAVSLHTLGAIHAQRGEFPAALSRLERALTIRSAALSDDSPLIADTLDEIARVLIQLETWSDASRRIDASLRIRERRARESPLALARTLELLAWLHRWSGNYAAATAAIDRGNQLRPSPAPDHPDLVFGLQVQGDVLLLSGDTVGAQRAWQTALRLAERTLRNDHPANVEILRRLGIAAYSLGDLAESQQLANRANTIGERSLAPCDPTRAGLAIGIGNSLEYNGDYAEARKVYREALARVRVCVANGQTSETADVEATLVFNDAAISKNIGDLDEAELLYQRAIEIWSKGLGTEHAFVARGTDALAEVVASRGQLTRARMLYEGVLASRRRTLGAHHPQVAWTLTNLASTVADLGDRPAALRYLDEAITIYRASGAADEPDHFARVLELRGVLEARDGRLHASRASLAQALAERSRIFGNSHPLVATTRATLAKTDLASGNAQAALEDALDAERAGREHLLFTVRYLPERQAMTYAAKRPQGLDLALTITATKSIGNLTAVLDAVIRSRGIVLDEFAARPRAASSSNPGLKGLVDAVTSSRQRFANLVVRSLQEPVPRNVLDEARRQKEDAERALAERSIETRAELTRLSAGTADVRRALPAGAALVSFVRYERARLPAAGQTSRDARPQAAYAAFVMHPAADDTAFVDLGPADRLDAAVTAWRSEAAGPSLPVTGAATDAERRYREASIVVRQLIWDPLASQVNAATRVFVVPDGLINLVKLAALPDGAGYVLERQPILHYLTTERDLLIPEREHGAPSALLAVGGPAFDERMPAATAQSALRGSECQSLAEVRFAGLPGSLNEVSDISALWPRSKSTDVTLLSGPAATESAVKRAVAGHRVVHLATHGFFLGSDCTPAAAGLRAVGGIARSSSVASVAAENPLLLTGLALAGANNRGGVALDQDEGLLTADEIAGLDLQGTEWAVLSACDTGLGEIKAGEGVFGLRRAFQIAGARTVIMSLWSVEDQSAREWMRALYEGRLRRNLDTAAAVREAGLSVLRARRARGQSTHPFYWAAFVAAGDWR